MVCRKLSQNVFKKETVLLVLVEAFKSDCTSVSDRRCISTASLFSSLESPEFKTFGAVSPVLDRSSATWAACR